MHRQLGWPIIDKDDAKDALLSTGSRLEDKEANSFAYDIIYRVAERQLQNGISVILDTPLARIELYKRALDVTPKVQFEADPV